MPLGDMQRAFSPLVTYHHRVRADDKALSASEDINDSTPTTQGGEKRKGVLGGGVPAKT